MDAGSDLCKRYMVTLAPGRCAADKGQETVQGSRAYGPADRPEDMVRIYRNSSPGRPSPFELGWPRYASRAEVDSESRGPGSQGGQGRSPCDREVGGREGTHAFPRLRQWAGTVPRRTCKRGGGGAGGRLLQCPCPDMFALIHSGVLRRHLAVLRRHEGAQEKGSETRASIFCEVVVPA